MTKINYFDNQGKILFFLFFALSNLQIDSQATAVGVSTPQYTIPPNISTSANKPMINLALSKDHTLWGPIYTDYEDLDGDGVLDTDYKPAFKYYGYFDPTKCYEYSATDKRFNPIGNATITTVGARYTCSSSGSYWSGNFLNWSSMGRIDVVRKMLYGGRRSTDTVDSTTKVGTTVLERAFLSYDAHSYVKYYKGTDIRDYTPFTTAALTKTTGANANTYAGLTICNTGESDGPTGAPIMRMAKGNYRLWGTVEHQVCRFKDEPTDADSKFSTKLANYYYDSDKGAAGVYHETTLPVRTTDGATYGSTLGPELYIRVKVCDPNYLGEEKCQAFPANSTTNLKPYGLFQEFGYTSQTGGASRAEFSVFTGSYDANKDAGILRKNMGDFSAEIDSDTGIFSSSGAIASINALQLYDRVSKNYSTVKAWGNPMAEMLIQTLRYYAFDGTSPTAYQPTLTVDTSTALGMTNPSWSSPISNSDTARLTKFGNAICRPKYNLLMSSSAVSYDGDAAATPFADLPNRAISGSGTKTLAEFTNEVGRIEGINGTTRSVGWASTTLPTAEISYSCSSKSVANLSDVTGICPESAAIKGTYLSAGAALYANTNNIRTFTSAQTPADISLVQDPLKIKTLVASLSGGSIRIEVPIPNTNPKKYVYITPESVWKSNIAAPLTFVSLSAGATYGTFMMTWNDKLEGGDYDMDLVGFLRYDLVANTSSPTGWDIKITTDVTNTCSGAQATYGFSVIGTNADQRYLTHQHWNTGKIWTTGAPSGYLCGDDNYRNSKSGDNLYDTKFTFNGTQNSTGACYVNDGGYCKVKDTAFPISVTFNMVGSTSGTLQEPLWYAAKYGGFASSTKNSDGTYTNNFEPTTTASWDKLKTDGSAGSDGIPDNYFLARRPDLLEAQLRRALNDLARNANTVPVVSTAQLQTDSKVFIASFDSSTISGDVKAYTISGSSYSSTESWSANSKLLTRLTDGTPRQIITNHGNQVSTTGSVLSDTGGMKFQWSALSSGYKTQMTTQSTNTLTDTNAQIALEYIRGDQSKEATSTGLRERGTNMIGAIVNGSPVLQTNPAANYGGDLFAGYNTFAANNRTREKLLWLAANDGMLHALSPETGEELFAYIPGPIANRLAEIPLQRGTTGRTRYNNANFTSDSAENLPDGTVWPYVDGTPFSGDIQLNIGTSSAAWKTYTFGTLGRGGKAVFALDTTNIDTLKAAETGTNAANIFRWQFTSDDDTDLGYIVNNVQTHTQSDQSTPIARLNNGKFALLLGNGYASTSGKAVLYLLYVSGPGTNGSWTGQYKKIELDSTGPGNGLIGANWIDNDLNGTTDWVYAGDLKGNIWKVDISNSDDSQWKSFYRNSSEEPIPMYTAKDGTTPLPITVAPTFAYTPKLGLMVTFGTGNAFSSTDYPNNSVTQKMYGLWEKSNATSTPSTFSNLATIGYTRQSNGNVTTSTTATDWESKDGWSFAFPNTSEMILSQAFMRAGNLIFTTVRPKNSTTSYCFVEPDVTLWAFSPLTGMPKDNILGTTTTGTDTFLNAGVATTAQQITFTKQGDKSIALDNTGKRLEAKSLSRGRMQWREIPGIRTYPD